MYISKDGVAHFKYSYSNDIRRGSVTILPCLSSSYNASRREIYGYFSVESRVVFKIGQAVWEERSRRRKERKGEGPIEESGGILIALSLACAMHHHAEDLMSVAFGGEDQA